LDIIGDHTEGGLGESTLLIDVASESRDSFDLNSEVELEFLFIVGNLFLSEHFEEFGAELSVVERISFDELQVTVHSDVDMPGIRLKVNVRAADLDTTS
jgi:hypothetical protein